MRALDEESAVHWWTKESFISWALSDDRALVELDFSWKPGTPGSPSHDNHQLARARKDWMEGEGGVAKSTLKITMPASIREEQWSCRRISYTLLIWAVAKPPSVGNWANQGTRTVEGLEGPLIIRTHNFQPNRTPKKDRGRKKRPRTRKAFVNLYRMGSTCGH